MNRFPLTSNFYHLFIPIVCILILSNSFGLAQNSNWSRDLYNSISHSNFKEAEAFQQAINTKELDYPLLNACIFFLTNEERAKKGKSPVSYAPQLEIAAWNHSKSMLEKDFFSHENPTEARRATDAQRAKLAGVSNPYIAENIAFQGGTIRNGMSYLEAAETFVEQWMNSTGHRKNILSKEALQLGCGVYSDGQQWYATQCFQWFQAIQPGKAKDKLPQ